MYNCFITTRVMALGYLYRTLAFEDNLLFILLTESLHIGREGKHVYISMNKRMNCYLCIYARLMGLC